MANKLILKKSSVPAKIPLAADLEVGELAVNLVEAKLYTKNASGMVIELGGASTQGAVVALDGPTSPEMIAGAAYTFTITNFDFKTAYSLSTSNGSVSRSGAVITYVPVTPGPAGFIVNGRNVVGYTAIQPVGQQLYDTPGTYSFIAPPWVTSVCAVAVGGGGGGGGAYWAGSGGGGGGLGWKNNIPVTPGSTYTVVVGAQGVGGIGSNGTAGGSSYFVSPTTVQGDGGGAGLGNVSGSGFPGAAGGSFVGDGGGNGGGGGAAVGDRAGGGGGAGGYSGSGGKGGSGASESGFSGSGGGGGGGGCGGGNTSDGAAPSGGGVGIFGQGASGTGGAASAGVGLGFGLGGSGGANGSGNLSSGGSFSGGNYGGGGGGQSSDAMNTRGCIGGRGAVRIIWGTGRAFPSTNTQNI